MKSDKNNCTIYEKKNEISENLKESLMDICLDPEIKYKEIEIIEEKEMKKIIKKAPYIINNMNENHINNDEQKILSKKENEDKIINNNIIKNDDIPNDLPPAYKSEIEKKYIYNDEENKLKNVEKKLLLINNK